MKKIASVSFFYNKITEDTLKIKFSEEYEIFDKFFIVESKKTHAFNDKLLNYNPKAFEPWKDKIEYVVVPDSDFFSDKSKWTPHKNEWRQRTWPLRSGMLDDYDFMHISDSDEVIAGKNKEIYLEFLEKIKSTNSSHGTMGYDCRRFFLDTQWYLGWEKPTVNISNHEIRQELLNSDKQIVKNRLDLDSPLLPTIESKHGTRRKIGWHFAIAGDANILLDKHKNCIHAHQYNKTDFNLNEIQQKLLTIPTLKEIAYFPKDSNVLDYPKFILDNWEYYKKYTYLDFLERNK